MPRIREVTWVVDSLPSAQHSAGMSCTSVSRRSSAAVIRARMGPGGHTWDLRGWGRGPVKFVFCHLEGRGDIGLLLLLLSRFSRVRLCATPQMAAHQPPPPLGFSRQEHWSGLPFPSPMHESEVAQSCPTLSDPMDCSPPGSSVHGIFQARVLEWGAIAFS